MKEDLFRGHPHPPSAKHSEDLKILILEFDDVIVKTIRFYCFLSSPKWGPEGGPVRGPHVKISLQFHARSVVKLLQA